MTDPPALQCVCESICVCLCVLIHATEWENFIYISWAGLKEPNTSETSQTLKRTTEASLFDRISFEPDQNPALICCSTAPLSECSSSERRSLISHDRNRLLDGKSARWIYFPFNTTENRFGFFTLSSPPVSINILIFCNIFCGEELVQTGRTHHWSCLILGYLGSVDTDASSHLCAQRLHWSESEEKSCQFYTFWSQQSFIILNSSNPWWIKSCLTQQSLG